MVIEEAEEASEEEEALETEVVDGEVLEIEGDGEGSEEEVVVSQT